MWVLHTVGLVFPLLNAAVVFFCCCFPLVANRRGKSRFYGLLCPCDTNETADTSVGERGWWFRTRMCTRTLPQCVLERLPELLMVHGETGARAQLGAGAASICVSCPGGTSVPRLCHAGWACVRGGGWTHTSLPQSSAWASGGCSRLCRLLPVWLWACCFISLPQGALAAFCGTAGYERDECQTPRVLYLENRSYW